jgi:hypothetical protein
MLEAVQAVLLYRIAYVSASQGHSVVRELAVPPVPGDEIALDAHTVVIVREIISHPVGATIAADVMAETVDATRESAMRATESAFRSSR